MPIIFVGNNVYTYYYCQLYTVLEVFWSQLTDHTSWLYCTITALLIIAFTYFYTAVTVNPTQIAEDLKRNNGFIPRVKPGKKTADYIDDIMYRITLPGSLFLALVAILPAFASIFGISREFAQFFGGTSLLILVGSCTRYITTNRKPSVDETL